jgi:hypothetical protein
MKMIWVYILLIALCLMQVYSLVKINDLEKDLVNIGDYLSIKIDNETSKVNEILLRIKD